ncbi:MAG: hypothetical protein K0V04_24515 [Deltaproteobacteria bacterium]|nr:hypothetical protein [Deltaproteobacteria bacterium]
MHRLTSFALALGLWTSISGCEPDQLPTFDREARSQTGPARSQRRHPRPPPIALLRLAIDLGGLSSDPGMVSAHQRMHDAHAEVKASGRSIAWALTEAVAAGSIEVEAFETHLALLEERAGDEALALALALNAAHSRLDTELRAELVASLPPPPATDEHPPESLDDIDQGPGHLLEALGLDDAQYGALAETLGPPPSHPPPPPIELFTFVDDSFDATTLGMSELHAEHLSHRAHRQIEMLAALLPLLDTEQRAALGLLLREGPPMPPRPASG